MYRFCNGSYCKDHNKLPQSYYNLYSQITMQRKKILLKTGTERIQYEYKTYTRRIQKLIATATTDDI